MKYFFSDKIKRGKRTFGNQIAHRELTDEINRFRRFLYFRPCKNRSTREGTSTGRRTVLCTVHNICRVIIIILFLCSFMKLACGSIHKLAKKPKKLRNVLEEQFAETLSSVPSQRSVHVLQNSDPSGTKSAIFATLFMTWSKM